MKIHAKMAETPIAIPLQILTHTHISHPFSTHRTTLVHITEAHVINWMEILLPMAFHCCHRCVFRIMLVAERTSHTHTYTKYMTGKKWKTHSVKITSWSVKSTKQFILNGLISVESDLYFIVSAKNTSKMELFNKFAYTIFRHRARTPLKLMCFGWRISMNLVRSCVSKIAR